MINFTLWIFDSRKDRIETLERHLRESRILRVVQGNGREVRERVGVDALWMTPTQASAWHHSDPKRLYEAEIVETPAEEVRKGFPPYLIVGIYLPPGHRLSPRQELELIARALVRSIEPLRLLSKKEVPSVATVPENLLLDKLAPEIVVSTIESVAQELAGPL